MTRKRSPGLKPLAFRTAELAVAAPQVAAARVARMALAGPVWSARDRTEFVGMVLEKQVAFAQSWMAMGGQMLRVQQALAETLMRAMCSPWGLTAPASGRAVSRLGKAVAQVADKGFAPIHGKALANARRLKRARRR